MLIQNMAFGFKGERDYVHGTDMFNQTLVWLGGHKKNIGDVDFSFHRLTSVQLQAVLGKLPDGTAPVAVCAFSSENERERVYLVETDQAIVDRYPYPEDEIVSRMEVDIASRKGVLRGETEYSDIEIWVAMNKALHLKVFQHLKGKWLFVRARFPSYICHSKVAERSLVIGASFKDKLTRSEVFLDGTKVGEIYFSIV